MFLETNFSMDWVAARGLPSSVQDLTEIVAESSKKLEDLLDSGQRIGLGPRGRSGGLLEDSLRRSFPSAWTPK